MVPCRTATTSGLLQETTHALTIGGEVTIPSAARFSGHREKGGH
jgi:hypothetical protein